MFFWVIIGINRGLIIQFTRFRVYVITIYYFRVTNYSYLRVCFYV